MKKILLIAMSFIISCSGSNDDANETSFPNEISIKEASLSPKVSVVSGYNSKIEYEVKLNNTSIPNNSLTWSVDNPKNALINYGTLYSRIIGKTKVTVRDKFNNALTAELSIEPSILDIPEIPYIEWGASGYDVMKNVKWSLQSNPFPTETTLIYTSGDYLVKYYISNTEGLNRIELSHKYEINKIEKYTSYLYERYEKIGTSDPGYTSHTRWAFVDSTSGMKTYIDIGEKSNLVYYFRYMPK